MSLTSILMFLSHIRPGHPWGPVLYVSRSENLMRLFPLLLMSAHFILFFDHAHTIWRGILILNLLFMQFSPFLVTSSLLGPYIWHPFIYKYFWRKRKILQTLFILDIFTFKLIKIPCRAFPRPTLRELITAKWRWHFYQRVSSPEILNGFYSIS